MHFRRIIITNDKDIRLEGHLSDYSITKLNISPELTMMDHRDFSLLTPSSATVKGSIILDSDSSHKLQDIIGEKLSIITNSYIFHGIITSISLNIMDDSRLYDFEMSMEYYSENNSIRIREHKISPIKILLDHIKKKNNES